MRVLFLSLLTLIVSVNSSVAAGKDDGWSKAVNGLQARLSFTQKRNVNGTPIITTYLELRNVADVANTMEIPLNPEKIRFTVTDGKGKSVKPWNGPFDGSRVELGMIRLPYDGLLRFNIASRGAGIPKDQAALIDLGPSHNWVFKRGDANAYHLQAEFTVSQTKARHWFGTIQIPKTEIPIPRPVVARQRPKPNEIVEFQAQPVPKTTFFKNFKIARDDLEAILSKWHQVSKERWNHGYSHVAMGDRTGSVKLKTDILVNWMVRPGGLATLTFPDGHVLYLARELTRWKARAEQVAAVDGDKPVEGDDSPKPRINTTDSKATRLYSIEFRINNQSYKHPLAYTTITVDGQQVFSGGLHVAGQHNDYCLQIFRAKRPLEVTIKTTPDHTPPQGTTYTKQHKVDGSKALRFKIHVYGKYINLKQVDRFFPGT